MLKRRHFNAPAKGLARRRACLLGLIVFGASLPASAQQDLDQIHYRWRYDDGTEATATFAAAEDAKLLGLPRNSVRRLRFEISNEGTASSGPVNFELQVAQTAACSAPAAAAKTLSAGYGSTCLLLLSGEIQCWGYNGQGQLGDGSTTDRSTPVTVSGITNATQVSAGESHTCAGFASGAIECWGDNSFGQLGDGTTTAHITPAPVPGITTASQVMAASYNSCAQLTSGGVQCWGINGNGELGDGTTTDRWSPVSVVGLSDAVQTTAGHYHTCSLRATGDADCWGNNSQGQVGDGNAPTDRLTPFTVSGLSNVVEVSAGGYHTCARSASGNVECWGRNTEGQIGDGTTTDRFTPVPVPGVSGVVELVAGGYHTCARLEDGRISCWGRGVEGQLGNGVAANRSTPAFVSGITNAVALASGHYHTCALLASGDVACWGANWFGEIGDGTTTQRNAPVTWTPSSAPALPNGYTAVPTGAGGHWQMIDSTFFTDGDPTSDISPGLTNEATTFVAGELKDTANATGPITLGADAFTELEFAVKVTPMATVGSNYCFRLYDAAGGRALDSYTVYAQAQLAGSTLYRSIGTASDYTAGTIDATAGSPVVTGTGTSWRAANRGRGDRIDIDGADYTILWVESDSRLTLTEPVSGNYSGSYTISRQFTTLAAWEDCIDGPTGAACTFFPGSVSSSSLVADDRREVGIAYNDSVVPADADFTAGVTIDGSITDANHDITLTVDANNRHYGIPTGGVLLDNGSNAANAIEIFDDYITVEWFEIRGGASGALPIEVNGITAGSGTTGASRILVRNNLIHDYPTVGIAIVDKDSVIDVYNNVVYSGQRGIRVNAPTLETWTRMRLLNNTVYDNSTAGFRSEATTGMGQLRLQNNIAAQNGAGTGFSLANASINGGSSHNLSTDGSAAAASPGGNELINQNLDTQVLFVDRAAGDLHLQGPSTAVDAGADLSSIFSWDVDLQSRPWGAQWDIGADERPPNGSCSVGQLAWYDPAWSFRKEIAIRSAQVAGVLTDFPVLINLASDPELAASAQDPNGDDILFTLSDGVTKLSHEIEKFDGGTGELVAWVKVPYLSSGADTNVFLYYGNPAAGNQEDAANVWGPDYKGVWHLKEDPSGAAPQMMDSTSNNNDGTTAGGMTSTDQVPGQIDGSLDFDGDDSINVGGNLNQTGELSVSAWFQPRTYAGNTTDVLVANNRSDGQNNYVFEVELATRTLQFRWGLGGVLSGVTPLVEGNSYYVVAVRSGATGNWTATTYVNGAFDNSTTTTADPNSSNWDTLIGARTGGSNRQPDGILDEVRISATVRSPEWIETEYNNQSDPSSFYLLCSATTEVELTSFSAEPLDGAVELLWETGSEIDNLGFHVYRSASGEDRYERITEALIPGLGSSPSGARYRYRDEGLTNGVTYYYKLEDVETTGKTAFHGPVWATPGEGASRRREEDTPGGKNHESSLITYGDPGAHSLAITSRGRGGVTLELVTGGFYATPQEDGSVRLEISGFDVLAEPGAPAIPIRRSWVEAIAGRSVELVSVTAHEVETFAGLRPSISETPDVVATRAATVRAVGRRRSRSFTRENFDGVYPREAAWLATVGFQGDVKKALVELAPLRWDPSNEELVLARRLVVRLSFQGRERNETSTDGVRGRRYRRPPQRRTVVARLATSERGLYAVRYQELSRHRRGLGASELRLSRLGESVPFHLEPSSRSFGPGSTLYFLGEGAEANPYGNEAVYELEVGSEGERMSLLESPPSGEPAGHSWYRLAGEENHLYQAALLDAPDVWLWDALLAPVARSYPFEVRGLAPSSEPSRLTVRLQGASAFPANPDHHVRVFVNGAFVAESSWDGKRSRAIEVEIPPGLLREGENTLKLENVGDTEAPYSMVLLDRFELLHPRTAVAEDGKLECGWSQSGTAELNGLTGLGRDTFVLDVTEDRARWLTGIELGADGALRFRAEAGSRYLAVSAGAVLRPEVRGVSHAAGDLTDDRSQADYLMMGPRDFLREAQPLLELRRSQGLTVKAVPIEDVYSSFGYGEPSPRAVKDFLSYAYHQWQAPSPRYVVLLGDATYDFKDYLGTGVANRVPPWMVKTTYLWTASDPTYAAVNGEDLLPDLAIGRLPAATAEEARAMVDKILAYETGDASLDRPTTVWIADNPDRAGDFEANAEEIASSVLASWSPTKIFLARLGRAQTREAIREAFDNGAFLMSYLGHGGIHLWADEVLLDIRDVGSLSPQPQQPLLFTMNCLNGYFHFPYFNSLAEELLKARDKGAIAAFSPSGLSLDAPAHRYHKVLLRELFSGKHPRLGDALLAGQAAYADTGALPELLSIYHLLGDPALTLR